MNAPLPLVDALESADWDRVRSVDGGHDKSLAVWLSGWRDGLIRFRSESDEPQAQWTDLTQHRHDWIGLLHTRAIVDTTFDQHRDEVPLAAVSWLSEVDQFMRSFTEEVPGWNPDGETFEGWWWARLPNHGPVRAGWWADQ